MVLAIGIGSVAKASDNKTMLHWDGAYVYYQIVTTTMNSDYQTAIGNAAAKWTWPNSTLSFYRGSDLSSADYSSTSTHIIWKGSLPSGWCSGAAIACTKWAYSGANNHLSDMDTVFVSSNNYTNTCPWWWFAAYDIETVMLHEFGHWGLLADSTDDNATMDTPYDTCDQTLTGHDTQSMNENYVH
jgi:hypothetical protein